MRGFGTQKIGVRVSVNHQIIFILYDDVARALDWHKGQRVALEIGRDEDHGKLRIGLSDNGFRLCRADYDQKEGSASRSLKFSSGMWSGGPCETHGRLPANYEIENGSILIHLPADSFPLKERCSAMTPSVHEARR
jgi:hypothetical protein